MRERYFCAQIEIGTIGSTRIPQWNESFSVQEHCDNIPEGMGKCDFEHRIVKIVQEIRLRKNVTGILQRRNSFYVCKCTSGEDLEKEHILHSACLDSPFQSLVAIYLCVFCLLVEGMLEVLEINKKCANTIMRIGDLGQVMLCERRSPCSIN